MSTHATLTITVKQDSVYTTKYSTPVILSLQLHHLKASTLPLPTVQGASLVGDVSEGSRRFVTS
jgi:hypothetical protein